MNTLPLVNRVQKAGYSDWTTERYDELGECEIAAHFYYAGLSSGQHYLLVRHEGQVKLAYLSRRESGEHTAVVHAAFDGPHPDQFAEILQAKKGTKIKTGQTKSCWFEVLDLPTIDTEIVIGMC